MQTLEELLRLPHPQALLAAGNSARLVSAANAEELCARSYAERYRDAGFGLRYAELAVVLARRSGSDRILGRALAYLGKPCDWWAVTSMPAWRWAKPMPC